jgi:cell division septal protein FtsQ
VTTVRVVVYTAAAVAAGAVGWVVATALGSLFTIATVALSGDATL